MGQAADAFDMFAPVTFSKPGTLKRLTLEGFLTAEQVTVDGVPAFVVFWSKTADDGIAINACQSLNAGVPAVAAFVAADQIKQRERLQHIRFSSIRGGLLELGRQLGYQFETVVMRKD